MSVVSFHGRMVYCSDRIATIWKEANDPTCLSDVVRVVDCAVMQNVMSFVDQFYSTKFLIDITKT